MRRPALKRDMRWRLWEWRPPLRIIFRGTEGEAVGWARELRGWHVRPCPPGIRPRGAPRERAQ